MTLSQFVCTQMVLSIDIIYPVKLFPVLISMLLYVSRIMLIDLFARSYEDY